MTKSLPVYILLGATVGCGGKPLDLGGVPIGDGGGSIRTNSTAIVGHQRNAASLHSEGSYLYWTTYDGTRGDRAYEICRCRKDDCDATRQTLFQNADAGRLLIRDGHAYFRHNGGIAACRIDDCAAPTVIITRASAAPSAVDDMYVYWWSTQDNALLSCPLTGCDAPSIAVAGVGPIIDAAVDDAYYFWTVWESATEQGIRSAPKYGTPNASGNKVTSQPMISSFVLDDAFVYWGQNAANGAIARTHKIRPNKPDPQTQVLTSGQYYPRALALDYDVLFWMNESAPAALLATVERPVQIVSCILPACETSIEVLDEAAGGSLANPVETYFAGGQLVVDAEAIYYIGDVTKSETSSSVVDASIRRLKRRADR